VTSDAGRMIAMQRRRIEVVDEEVFKEVGISI
jgi:hypothetical protein